MRILKTVISVILVTAMLMLCIACDLPQDSEETLATDTPTETTEETEETSAPTDESDDKKEDSQTPPPQDKNESEDKDSIKILAIGNSFSDDAMAYLWDMLRAAGYKKVIIANVYKGGCSLDTHYSNYINDTAAYTYKKNSVGSFVNTTNSTMKYGLNDEEWDYITLQQASGSSGQTSTYSSLNGLLSAVRSSNPQAKIYWHMTWAYQQNSTHASFANYNKNQTQMYNAIVNAVNSKIVGHSVFTGIIPAGTSIQNLRTSHLGDTLTRDGYHMSYDFGRYTVALTWLAIFCGKQAVDDITWVPSSYSSLSAYLPMIKESVKNAIDTPFAVTNSTYSSLSDAEILAAMGLDISQYNSLFSTEDWYKNAYYNTSNESKWNVMYTTSNSTAENLKKFATTKMFTKADIPVGSVIIIDANHTYRPEGWVSLTDNSQNPTTRAKEVSTQTVMVTAEWWGSYVYRAFNLKHTSNTYSTDAEFLELISHIRIYVPKTA